MLDPQKTLECEALLKRYRELEAEIAQHERNLREGEARLPIEEQLTNADSAPAHRSQHSRAAGQSLG
jgi:hypothetical protein